MNTSQEEPAKLSVTFMAQLCQGCLKVTSVLMSFGEANRFLQRDEPEIQDEHVILTYTPRMQETHKPKASAAMIQLHTEVMGAILCWHFISVPVTALSLSSAPSGQRCTQLKTCNSLSGI